MHHNNKLSAFHIGALCLAVWLCSVGLLDSVRAQPRNLAFTHLTVDNGLSHNTVFDVIQDKEGYLWISTEEGLNRYDGYDFEVFTFDLSDSTSLADNWASSIFEDSHGNIWISTDSGVNRFVPETRNFKRYHGSGLEVEVWSVAQDHNDHLWVATSGGLYEIDILADSLVGGPYRYEGAPDPFIVRTVAVDPENRIWVGTRRNGALQFDRESRSFSALSICENEPCTFSGTVFQFMFHAERTLIATQSGLYVGSRDLMSWEYFGREAGSIIDFPFNGIIEITPDTAASYWLGTRSEGMIHLDIENKTYQQYKHDDSQVTSLVTNEVRTIFIDRFGVMWVGAGALSKLDPQIGIFELVQFNPRNINSLSDNAVTSLLQDVNPDIIWIGTIAGGLNRYNQRTGEFFHFRPEPGNPNSLSINHVEALHQDQAGNVWVGTRDGLNLIRPGSNAVERYFYLGVDQPYNWIRVIHPSATQEGVFWLSRGSEGLYRFYPEKGTMEAVDANKTMWISSIYEDKKGNVWLGTEGDGLKRYSPETNQYQSYVYTPNNPHSLKSKDVYAIHAWSDSVFWLGTSKGLVHFLPRSGKFTHYTTTNSGLPHDTVYGILQDDTGRLWISTLNGFALLNPATMEFSSLVNRSGLQGKAFNKFAYHKGASGEMFFGGPNGFNYFRPEEIKVNPVAPELKFTDLKLFDQSIREIPEHARQYSKLNSDSALVFNAGQNDVRVDFVGLHFSNPGQIEYMYRINRENQDWRNVGNQRSVNINGLTPGEYKLEVLAINADGIESVESEIKSLNFNITPPWWRTPWAYMIYACIIGVAVFAVSRYQKNRLIQFERARAEEERKELELQKARQLQLAYDALQTSMEELKRTQEQLVQAEKMASLGQLTAGIAHEIKNPLNFINNFAVLQTDYLNDLKIQLDGHESDQITSILSTVLQNADHIHKHGQRADRIVQTMMQHVGGTSGKRDQVNVNDIIAYAVTAALGGFDNKGILEKVNVDTNLAPNMPLVSAVSTELSRVFINLLTNAFAAVLEKAEKETHFNPQVWVQTSHSSEKVVIRIEDNGPGIPVENHQKIFDPFFTTRKTGEGNIGLGLSLSFDIIVRGHQGKIQIDEGKQGGAVFIIHLPI